MTAQQHPQQTLPDGNFDYDYVIIGSGFGGSVSALRLSEKGYKVAVIEQGKWYRNQDFADTNWNLKRWMWKPSARLFGIMQISFLRHITVISGVGVGGGSLVYACTLPIPKTPFFESGSWANLTNWETRLAPFYQTAYKMLGAANNSKLEAADLALQKLAVNIGKPEEFHPTKVGIFFGEAGKTVADPFFEGQGPERTGCIRCGSCMTGCKHNAKNSLDKNYLYLAQAKGAVIQAESRVINVTPNALAADGSAGYTLTIESSSNPFAKKRRITAKGVVFSAGVLGTVPLLLKLKETSLPRLSSQVGQHIRTNNENLIAVSSLSKKVDYSQGIAIGSIVHTDDHSHLEICRYGAGSGFWRTLMMPRLESASPTILGRLFRLISFYILHPIKVFKLLTLDDWAKRTTVLLFMQHLNSTLQFKRKLFGGIKTAVTPGGEAPSAFIPHALTLGKEYANIVEGVQTSLATESIFGIPGTAHILGGAVMGDSTETGVIDHTNHVYGYHNMLVCDGSMISANPGVNPSLSITAISEHAMSLIADKT